MEVAIRVDASTTIGLGHIKRCLSLAEALRVLGARVVFVVRDIGIDVERQVASAGFQSFTLPAGDVDSQVTQNEDPPHVAWARTDWQTDARQTAAALSECSPHWLIVDHYSFDARWHSDVAARLNVSIAVIDDLADRPLRADVLLDHNFDANHREKYRDRISSRTKLLGGPRFALLGPSYRNPVTYEFHDAVRSIGIFMGGVDARGLSFTVLRGCREIAAFKGPIEVVTTQSNPKHAELRSFAARWPLTRVSADLPNLAEFFARHDLQIGAGGGATWERSAVGVPSLLLVAAENQRTVVSALAEQGAAATLESNDSTSKDEIGEAIVDLIGNPERRRSLSEIARRVVDGRGASRVALCLLKSELKVRPAELRDTDMMFEWRNHLNTRALSRDSASLDPENHARWVMQAVSDPDRCLLIGHVGNLDVGVIRFDKQDGGYTEISLYLDPGLHGLGLGAALLREGEAYIASAIEHTVRLVATVLNGNIASERLFESCAYRFVQGRWQKTLLRQERMGRNRAKDC